MSEIARVPRVSRIELVLLALGIVAVLFAAAVTPALQALQAWGLVAILGVAYMLSRGLARGGPAGPAPSGRESAAR